MIRLSLATALSLLIATPALACGTDTDCNVADRTYRIAMPEAKTAKTGALIFAH